MSEGFQGSQTGFQPKNGLQTYSKDGHQNKAKPTTWPTGSASGTTAGDTSIVPREGPKALGLVPIIGPQTGPQSWIRALIMALFRASDRAILRPNLALNRALIRALNRAENGLQHAGNL